MSANETKSHPPERSQPPDYGASSLSNSPPSLPSNPVNLHMTAHSITTEHPPHIVTQQPFAMAVSETQALTPFQHWAANANQMQLNALAGAFSGFTSGVVTCPLDVIKTKLQAQGGIQGVAKGHHAGPPRVYSGLIGTAKVIWREERIRGLYRGLGPIILGYLPTWAVWFTVYNKSKDVMSGASIFKQSDAQKGIQADTFGDKQTRDKILINFGSSVIAGASSTIVTNPIWVIKTRLMSQSPSGYHQQMSLYPRSANTPTSRPISSPWYYKSTLDAARKMYTSEGILSFYSGLTPALLGLAHVALQFPAYEYLRTRFTGQEMGSMDEKNASKNAVGILSATILSKMFASMSTYPHEVIRTRLQTQRRPTPSVEYLQGLDIAESTSGAGEAGKKAPANPSQGTSAPQPKYRGVFMTFQTILREEGWRAFYAGMGVNLMRAVPAACVTMMTYEFLMKQLKHEQAKALSIRDHGRKLDDQSASGDGLA